MSETALGAAPRLLHLLVIDDDDVDRERVRRLAARAGIRSQIVEAGSGAEAAARMKEHRFDCVILDHRLGDTTGTELVREIRRSQRPWLPIIMITGLGDEQVAVSAMREGVTDYIPKARLCADRLLSAIQGSLRWSEMAQRLSQTERRLAQLEYAAEGIAQLDLAGRYVSVNEPYARMVGHRAEDLIGVSWRSLVHPDDVGALERANQEMVAKGKGAAEVRGLRRDGRVFYSHVVVVAARDEEGRLFGNFCLMNDVSERHEVNRMKDEFISVVSHELRTPLTSIRGSLGLLAAGHLGDLSAEAQQVAEIAVRSADRLVRLINDLLDLERMEAGRVTMDSRVVDAGVLAEQVLEEIKPMADRAGVVLQLEGARAALWADVDRVAQALSNLVSNAIKFSAMGGQVHLRVQPSREHVVFEVRDHGRGIPESRMEAVFERFQQVDASDSRQKGGTGLGLPICRTIATQHGGRVWVESKLGAGSAFFLQLPRLSASLPLVESEEGGGALILDSDGGRGEALRQALDCRGLRASVVRDVDSALERLRGGAAALLIVTVRGLDDEGGAVIDEVRRSPQPRDVPLLVLGTFEPSAAERARLAPGRGIFFTRLPAATDQLEPHVVAALERIFRGEWTPS